MDGTFSIVPKPYYQLVTIGYIEDNVVFRSIFALLPDKRKRSYENFFRIIKHQLGELTPTYIKCDFETALWGSVLDFFPGSIISGANFIWGHAVKRYIQSLGTI